MIASDLTSQHMVTKKQLISMLDSYGDDDVVEIGIEHTVKIRTINKAVNGTDGVEQAVADEVAD